MHYRHVGHSGLAVSAFGLGTWGWSESVDEYEAGAILSAFIDAGGTLVDTASYYADGGSEEMLGRVMKGLRKELVIASKAGIDRGQRNTSVKSLLDSLDGSLSRLQCDVIDLWQISSWDRVTPLEEVLSAAVHAVRAGKARYIGVSNFAPWTQAWFHQAAQQESIPVISNQLEYSLLQRNLEGEHTDACLTLGSSVLAWSPLGRGVLTGKYRVSIPGDSRAASNDSGFVEPYLPYSNGAIVEAVGKAAEGLNLSMTDIALAWVVHNKVVASALLGARTATQLKQNLSAVEVELPEAIYQALNDVSQRS